jgi:hypothetical protein
MVRAIGVGAATAGAVGGLVAVRRARRSRAGSRKALPTWLGVTVLAAPDEIAPGGELPAPLRELGDAVEVRMQPAPGDRGTELYARRTDGAQAGGRVARLTGSDPLAPLRQALREAKSLVECGEVVRADAPSTTHPGPLGRLQAVVNKRAQGAGQL